MDDSLSTLRFKLRFKYSARDVFASLNTPSRTGYAALFSGADCCNGGGSRRIILPFSFVGALLVKVFILLRRRARHAFQSVAVPPEPSPVDELLASYPIRLSSRSRIRLPPWPLKAPLGTLVASEFL